MKIGSIDIIKAYLGTRELTKDNAFLGVVPVISGEPTPVTYDGLTFVSKQDGSTIKVFTNGVPSFDIQYSTDAVTWNTLGSTAITINNGSEIYVRGKQTSQTNSHYRRFIITGNVAVKGNINYLWNYENPNAPLNQYCGYYLFYQCEISDASELILPATTLAYYSYYNMFYGCTKLTTAPSILPATTLANRCYYQMFANCTSLTRAPELPATNISDYCYQFMFSGCTSLVAAPSILPSKNLSSNCYNGMFYGCTRLTTAPELPALTLANYSYFQMFYGCTSLNYIKCLATDKSANNCTGKWVTNVSSTGKFYKNPNMNSWATGDNGIPSGWTVFDDVDAVTFVSKANNSTIGLSLLSSNQTYEYSTDAENWTNMTTATTITLNNGNKVYIRGTLNGTNTNADYTQFTITGNVAIMGKLGYLTNYSNPDTLPQNRYEYYRLFKDCTGITETNKIEMPSKPNEWYVYQEMFMGCTNLTNTPELSATELTSACYQNMFYGCTSLTSVSALPALELGDYCYNGMFRDCTSLTTVPALPATTLKVGCYYQMFRGCTNITTVPELPALTLANYAYRYMFDGCTKINNITCLATDISATDCTQNWVRNVAASGTFHKNANMSSWTRGVNGIPSNWSVQDA